MASSRATLVDRLRLQITRQRSVRMLGYMGDGVEVSCDDLDHLLEVVEAFDVYRAGIDRTVGKCQLEAALSGPRATRHY